jgi:hypothetical protein
MNILNFCITHGTTAKYLLSLRITSYYIKYKYFYLKV